MAQQASKLTDYQKQQFADWLREKVPELQCTVCHNVPLVIEDYLAAPWTTNSTGGWFTSYQYPMFQLTCTNCGHVHFFNAAVTGIVDPRKPFSTALRGGLGSGLRSIK